MKRGASAGFGALLKGKDLAILTPFLQDRALFWEKKSPRGGFVKSIAEGPLRFQVAMKRGALARALERF